MKQFERITQIPGVMGGKACIHGMRVTVGNVVAKPVQLAQSKNCSRITRTWNARISFMRSATRHGSLRNAKLFCRTHENFA